LFVIPGPVAAFVHRLSKQPRWPKLLIQWDLNKFSVNTGTRIVDQSAVFFRLQMVCHFLQVFLICQIGCKNSVTDTGQTFCSLI